MKAPVILTLILAAVWLAAGCGSEHVRRTDGDGDSDSDGDSDGDGDGDGDRDADVTLECGDEREPIDIPPEPIVNGQPTWDPSVVDLTTGQALAVGAVMSRDGSRWTNVCTATLIAPRVVLTAAHCVIDFFTGRDLSASQLRFAIGDDVSSPVYTFSLDSAQSHPDYGGGWGGDATHDIGVMVLSEDATAAVPEIQPIAINCDPPTRDEFVGQDVQNVGYGITEPSSWWPPPDENTIKYWTIEEVFDLTTHDFTVDGHGESSVCNGDSGGPSLWTVPSGEIRVMGTVSWGDPSCVDHDHYARVDDNCEYIGEFLEGCGEVTTEGTCDGDVAIYCAGGAVSEVDCATLGMICGDAGDGRMRCIEPSDPCAGETETGRCDGDVAIWCEDDAVQTVDCGEDGLICGRDAAGSFRCIEDACDGVTWAGYCDGPDAIWCDSGQLRVRNCADCEQVCGWSDTHEGYYCI